MKIKINIHTEHQVIESVNPDTEEIDSQYMETFKVGEVHDVDIYEDHGDTVDIQFGDGSMAYNFPKAAYSEVQPAFTPKRPPKTYRELGEAIACMNDEQLDSTITVEDADEDECWAAELRIAGEEHDSLDENHPIIFIPPFKINQRLDPS